jgi:hypothetical protein
MPSSSSTAPEDLGPAGSRLFESIVADYALAEHELALLCEASRTADACAELARIVEHEGYLVDGKVHPAVAEARQQRILLARLLTSLRVPLGDQEDQDQTSTTPLARRPQHRGTRGSYNPRSA